MVLHLTCPYHLAIEVVQGHSLGRRDVGLVLSDVALPHHGERVVVEESGTVGVGVSRWPWARILQSDLVAVELLHNQIGVEVRVELLDLLQHFFKLLLRGLILRSNPFLLNDKATNPDENLHIV